MTTSTGGGECRDRITKLTGSLSCRDFLTQQPRYCKHRYIRTNCCLARREVCRRDGS